MFLVLIKRLETGHGTDYNNRSREWNRSWYYLLINRSKSCPGWAPTVTRTGGGGGGGNQFCEYVMLMMMMMVTMMMCVGGRRGIGGGG